MNKKSGSNHTVLLICEYYENKFTSVFCREKKFPTCRNGPAQNFRDENLLSVEIRGAGEHGPELAQTILPGLKASNLFNADVHVIVEEIYALGMTIVRVENFAHFASVARPIVS